jgi:CRP-like cAMP-binding protein
MQYQLPYFEDLCPSWGSISHLGVRHIFHKGSQIIGLESTVDGVYFVQQGVVEILLYTARGPEKVLFYVGSGCIFGEVSCFVGGASEEASVRARSDCVLYFFNRELVEGLVASLYPHLLIELIRASAYKIRMYGVLLQDSLTSDNFTRVCKMLVYLVRFRSGEQAFSHAQVTIQPDLTQNDIARLLGVHRVTVTKSISRLKEMGVLGRFSKKSLVINDFPALLGLAEKESL